MVQVGIDHSDGGDKTQDVTRTLNWFWSQHIFILRVIPLSCKCFTDPTKFFGCELGEQTQIDLKNERYIFNGAHDGDKLQEILDEFIQKFVLCPECENPETVLVSRDVGNGN